MRRILLAAPSGAGKSTALETLVSRASDSGVDVRGILSPGVYEPGPHDTVRKTAIDLVLLPDEERLRLAVPKSDFLSGREEPRIPGAMDGKVGFDFDPDVIEEANRYFRDLRLIPSDASRLVIVDEIGPLEVIRGEGIVEALAFLDDDEREETVVITSRPELVETYLERWSGAEVIGITALIELP